MKRGQRVAVERHTADQRYADRHRISYTLDEWRVLCEDAPLVYAWTTEHTVHTEAVIEPAWTTDLTGFANHSSDRGNVILQYGSLDVVRDIRAGDEITNDYYARDDLTKSGWVDRHLSIPTPTFEVGAGDPS